MIRFQVILDCQFNKKSQADLADNASWTMDSLNATSQGALQVGGTFKFV